MYAISHAASALLLKKTHPAVAIWPLLVSTQVVELMWCGFVWTGVERVSFHEHHVSLDFLPYSHSVGTGVGLALLALALLFRLPPRLQLARGVALGVVSHVLLDLVQHEPDIRLLPWADGPRLGLSLMDAPLLNALVELAFGILCWRVYGGRVALLVGIIAFNLMNLPTMLQPRFLVDAIAAHPASLPALILAQIVATWVFVAWGSAAPGSARAPAPAPAH